MYRLFDTHKIRKNTELSGSFWDFSTYDGDGSVNKKVLVPSCWQSYPETTNYIGRASYKKDVYCDGNVRFIFKGVAHTADVFFDGDKIAHHYNAFTEFDALVRNVSKGVHLLEVIADNTLDERSALHVENDYFNYGGITRSVVMEEVSDVYIKYVHFTPFKADGTWHADIEAHIINLSDKDRLCSVNVGIEEIIGGKRIATYTPPATILPSGESVLNMHLDDLRVCEWNLEEPVLYNLCAVLSDENGSVLDDLIDRIGFRQVEVIGSKIFLNGDELKVRGFCRHEEHPQFGSSLPLSAMEQDIMLMQDLGANSIRTTHYPNDELFLDLCDEQGILVWEENHARGLSEDQMRNPNFETQAEDCIKEMIICHYNHPSIYIWGILNECSSDTEYGSRCYSSQYDLIKTLDPDRPRSSASCKFKTDICFGYPEVVSYNIYPLWYHNTDPKEYIDDLYNWIQDKTEGAGKPFLITEVGAGAIYGNRTPMKTKWSEEYQAEALRRQLKAIFESDYCSGVYIWQFCDGKVSDEWWSGRPRTMNNKGIVDEYRRPKMAYQVVKDIYNR